MLYEVITATSPYRFADTEADYSRAIEEIGLPCVVKPVMSSSGKGQSVVRQAERQHDDGHPVEPRRRRRSSRREPRRGTRGRHAVRTAHA